MNQPSKGFTLIELVVVLAIICILAAIFYPIYQDYTDPVGAAKRRYERATRDYNRDFPCINGVRYIRSTGKSDSLTPMIDPTTMQPQLCEAEKVQ